MPLKVFTDDVDTYVASDLDDALACWVEQNGGTTDDTERDTWEELLPFATLTIWCNAEGKPDEPHARDTPGSRGPSPNGRNRTEGECCARRNTDRQRSPSTRGAGAMTTPRWLRFVLVGGLTALSATNAHLGNVGTSIICGLGAALWAFIAVFGPERDRG